VTAVVQAGGVVARDLLVRVAEEADRYAIHAGLDARFGRRGDAGYLWTLGRIAEGPAARVRLPMTHPEAKAGLDIRLPAAHAVHAFRLTANVTRKIGRSGKRASWPRGEIRPREIWLHRRAEEHGFRVDELAVEVDRAFVAKGRGCWLDVTVFTGTMTVRDPERFARALVEGVGQRGAFGFGLLEMM
jgi:hypothetical protein